jgi:Zn-dependent protease
VSRQIAGKLLSVPVFSANGIFFWCAGFIVRFRYTFLLTSVLMAANGRRDFVGVLVWVLASTFGVLLHELGHALAARHYGAQPVIELHAMGGVTSWEWTRSPRWTHLLVCSLAGPAIGIAFGLLLWLAQPLILIPVYWVVLLVMDLGWVLIGWSVFNLLPILPMDGGHALEALLAHWIGADRARYRTRVTSLVVASLMAALAVSYGMMFAAVMCVLFAYNNAMALRGMPGIRITG